MAKSSDRNVWGGAVLVFAIVLVAAAAASAIFIARRDGGRPKRVDLRENVQQGTSAPSATGAATRPARLYRVGVIVSHFSATGPGWGGQVYGYSYQHALRELRHPHVKIIPLIEPGTADEPDVAKALATTFKHSPPIDITDAAALKGLDVIVTSRAMNARPAALAAIESAVSEGGVGLLLWANLGDVTPGFGDPVVARLTGLREPQFGYTPDPPGVACDVVAAHPILGPLQPGAKLKLQASGAHGTLPPHATALVTVSDPTAVRTYNPTTRPTRDGLPFHPIYVSRLGKGRIVGCMFPAVRQLPPSLNRATGREFLLRCVRWLSEEPVDAAATTTSSATTTSATRPRS